MTTAFIIGIICAIISPFIWGLMNVMDKFVIAHKVKNVLSFAFIAGMVNLCFGLILSLFLDWKSISLNQLLFPIIAGVLVGSQFYTYYLILKKEDVSNMVGYIYFYPIIVALLSYLFLNEKLSIISYIGMSVIISGVTLLSFNNRKIKLKTSAWMLIIMVLTIALTSFFTKIATQNINELNGIAIESVTIGLTLTPLILVTSIRRGIKTELKNVKWALLNETMTFSGIVTSYFAMSALPATIVASIAATQPLTVLFIEKTFNKLGLKISEYQKITTKLVPILLIIFGIILLYLPEILNLIHN